MVHYRCARCNLFAIFILLYTFTMLEQNLYNTFTKVISQNTSYYFKTNGKILTICCSDRSSYMTPLCCQKLVKEKSVFFRFNLLTLSVTKKTISCQRKENFSPSFNDSHSCKGSTASTLALMKKNWQTLFLVTKHWQTLFLVTKHWQTLANIDKQTLVNKQLSSKK